MRYVTVTTAKYLKELGYDKECKAYYNTKNGDTLYPVDEGCVNTEDYGHIFAAPCQMDAMEWVRITFHVFMEPNFDHKDETWGWRAFSCDADHVQYNIEHKISTILTFGDMNKERADTFEDNIDDYLHTVLKERVWEYDRDEEAPKEEEKDGGS